jgi:predicted RNA-binding Zn ribbon-like protein
MASTLVGGYRLPISIGGHPAIDFCNTRARWALDDPKEYLVDYPHLVMWTREAGLVSAATTHRLLRAAKREPAAADAIGGAAIDFRTALYDVLVGPASSAAWRHVSTAASAANAAIELTPGDRTSDRPAGWQLPEGVGLVLPLLAVIGSATELLTSPLGAAVDACPMPDCGWAFANPSGRRTWCSMAWCGNRTKVRRYAARHRG